MLQKHCSSSMFGASFGAVNRTAHRSGRSNSVLRPVFVSTSCPTCYRGDPRKATLTRERDQTVADEVDGNKFAESGASILCITFVYHLSRDYRAARALCRGVSRRTTERIGFRWRRSVYLDLTDAALAARIWALVGRWKSSRLTLDGQETTIAELACGGLGYHRGIRPSRPGYAEPAERRPRDLALTAMPKRAAIS